MFYKCVVCLIGITPGITKNSEENTLKVYILSR